MATIRKRELKSGTSYVIQVKFTDKGSGQQIVRSRVWKPEPGMTIKQASRAVAVFADEFEKEVKESISGSAGIIDNPNITFREFSEQWLERTKRDQSLSYYVHSQRILEQVNKSIGGYKLRELTPAILQNYFNKLDSTKKVVKQVTPKPDFRKILNNYGYNYMNLRYNFKIQSCSLANALAGKPVSKTWSSNLCERLGISFDELFQEKITETEYAYETIHKYKSTIRAILSLAKKNRLVADNYATADYIDFPKKPAHRIECMDDEQARRFYETVIVYPNIKIKTAMLVFLLTGFRRGEVAGLEWKDIDFKNNTITVSRSITTVEGYGSVQKEPKTENSKRTITAAKTLMYALKEYKLWQDMQKEALGDYMMDSDKVFTQENGKNINPSTFYGWLKKVLKAANLEHHSLHSIRHTNITMQIAAGVPLVTVAARAGHARASTTTDVYAHFIKSSDQIAADSIDKMFNPDMDIDDSSFPKQLKDKSVLETKPKTKVELVLSFRKAKMEMERLGIDTYDEYLDYLEFEEAKKKNDLIKDDNQME